MKNKTPQNFKRVTIKFNENYNKKLYGRYFTTIRAKDYDVIINDVYDIELKGKSIMLAKVIGVDTIKFHELSQVSIMMDTGLNYSDALTLFQSFGFKVSDFELEVKYILLEVISVIKNQPTAG